MASSYPGAFDSFPTITADKLLSDAVGGRAHRAIHNDMGDVIEAMQAELGLDPAGAAATVAERLAAMDARITALERTLRVYNSCTVGTQSLTAARMSLVKVGA